MHVQRDLMSLPPRTYTYTLMLSYTRTHSHTHKQPVFALLRINHCDPRSSPPHTYKCTLVLSHTRMHTYTHKLWLHYCAFFTATLHHFPLVSTPTPFCSLSHVRTHTHTTRCCTAACSSPRLHIISSPQPVDYIHNSTFK